MSEPTYLKTVCKQCGGSVEFPEESEGATTACPHCGKDLFLYRAIRAVGTPPVKQNDFTPNPPTSTPILWNPLAAARWSLIFSPAFGAFIHAQNADILGRKSEAKTNRIWFYVSVVFLVFTIITIFIPAFDNADAIFRWINLGILVGWYSNAGRNQVKYVKETWAKNYLRKSWTVPLSVAFGCLIVMMAVIVIALSILPDGSQPTQTQPAPQQDQTASNQAAPTPQDLKSKAESGDADAQFKLGSDYFNGDGEVKDEAKAVTWWRKAAEQNNDSAQYGLGVCYYYGFGVAKDEVEAVNWWRKAAQQNNANAQCSLGICYFNGKGVEQSAEQAVNWWRKAAEQNHTKAQYYLGNSYEFGQGVGQDWVEASKWLQLASDKGDSDATKLLIARKNMEDAAKAAEDRIINGDPSFQATVVPIAETPQVTATNVTAKVTESNASYWKWTWKLTLLNYSSDPVNVNTAVQFLDKDGYLVDEDKYGVQNAVLPARSSQTFTGLRMIRLPATKNVASIGAKVEIQ